MVKMKFVTARNMDIYILRSCGFKYKDIAAKHNISINRARQIYEKFKKHVDLKHIPDPLKEIADADL